MSRLVVHPQSSPLHGSVPVPSDGTIGHRALLLAALCEGASTLRGLTHGEDAAAMANALRAMGVTIEELGGGHTTEARVTGVGLFGLKAPEAALDCGGSSRTMRLLAGLLAAQPFRSTLTGDASLAEAPMTRVVRPLRARGAAIDGQPHPTKDGEIVGPLGIGPLPDGQFLKELELESDVPSADRKSAVLLSGLYAHGATYFKEPMLSPDHTERMLHALGVPLRAVGTVIELDPGDWDGKMSGFDLVVPGDASAAAFLVVAANTMPGSRVTVRGVGANPTRTGLFEIARHMGAGLDVVAKGEQAGEPVAEMTAWHQPMTGTIVGGETVPRAIAEIPIACALAACASGKTTIRDAEELRAEGRDRLAAMATVLRAFGVACEELPDGLVIEGRPGALEPAEIDSRGDPAVAMSAAVLALRARAPSAIHDCDAIAASFPRFVGTLRALGARIDVA